MSKTHINLLPPFPFPNWKINVCMYALSTISPTSVPSFKWIDLPTVNQGFSLATLNKHVFFNTPKTNKKKRTKTPIHHQQASIFQAAKLENGNEFYRT